MSDFFAIMQDVLSSLKALLMCRDVACRTRTRETPQIDYNAKKRLFFFFTGNYREPEAEYNPASTYNDNKGTWDVWAGAELQGTGYSSALFNSTEAHSTGKWFHDQQSRKNDRNLGKVQRNWSHPGFGGIGACISAAEPQRDETGHERQPECWPCSRPGGKTSSWPSPCPWRCVLEPWGSPLDPAEEQSSPKWPVTTKQTHAQVTFGYKTT